MVELQREADAADGRAAAAEAEADKLAGEAAEHRARAERLAAQLILAPERARDLEQRLADETSMDALVALEQERAALAAVDERLHAAHAAAEQETERLEAAAAELRHRAVGEREEAAELRRRADRDPLGELPPEPPPLEQFGEFGLLVKAAFAAALTVPGSWGFAYCERAGIDPASHDAAELLARTFTPEIVRDLEAQAHAHHRDDDLRDRFRGQPARLANAIAAREKRERIRSAASDARGRVA